MFLYGLVWVICMISKFTRIVVCQCSKSCTYDVPERQNTPRQRTDVLIFYLSSEPTGRCYHDRQPSNRTQTKNKGWQNAPLLRGLEELIRPPWRVLRLPSAVVLFTILHVPARAVSPLPTGLHFFGISFHPFFSSLSLSSSLIRRSTQYSVCTSPLKGPVAGDWAGWIYIHPSIPASFTPPLDTLTSSPRLYLYMGRRVHQ